MANGYSLRLTASLVGVSLPTAFRWRHKLLTALRMGQLGAALTGIVEFDEVYVLESSKGSRRLMRPPRERGTGRSIARGPGFNRVCLLAGQDRRGGYLFRLMGAGALRLADLERVLDEIDFSPTALCVDTQFAYWPLSVRLGVPRYLFRSRFGRQGVYHQRNVDRFLIRFKRWLLEFRGVATKYLANYVTWYSYRALAESRGMCPSKLARFLLTESFGEAVEVTNDLPFAL